MRYRRFNTTAITRRWTGNPNNTQISMGNGNGNKIASVKFPRDELDHIVQQSGVRLTRDEVGVLRKRLDRNGNVTMAEFRHVGRESLENTWARELCLSVAEAPTTKWGSHKTRMIQFLDFGGKALFAVVGTQVAGDVGMNIVGCTFVGCVSCLGGGTLNNLLYGTPVIMGKPGVNWVNNPRIFYVAIAASVFTFFAWPHYCNEQAKRRMKVVFGKENLERDGSVGRVAFYIACSRHPELKAMLERGLKMKENEDPAVLFDAVDLDGSGYIEADEMQSLVGLRFNTSSTLYALDTVALSALAVVGVHNAIGRGLAPLVAASSGVTICFGGILRDLLCGRDVLLGAQSYALATGAGSAVYILIREMSLRGMPVHMAARILLSISTTITIRILDYINEGPLLKPMHYHRQKEKNEILLRRASEEIIDPNSLESELEKKQKSLPLTATTSLYEQTEM